MRSPEDIRARLRTRYRRSLVPWLALPPGEEGAGGVLLSFSVEAPTARTAREEPARVGEWMAQWSRATSGDALWTPVLEQRRWAGIGEQSVPVRIEVRGVRAVAGLTGESRDWRALSGRLEAMLARWGCAPGEAAAPAGAAVQPVGETETREVFARALGSVLAAVRSCSDEDFDRSLRVADWVVQHPGSDLLLRQIPLEGMDTKWMEHHRRLVSAFVAGVRDAWGLEGGTDLGLRTEFEARDVVVLDPQLRPGRGPDGVPAGLRHFRADAAELAGRWVSPATPGALLVCENRQSIVALPDMGGVVALHGGGYAVSEMEHLVWAREIPVLYWGDLDADGFAILNRLRHHHPRVRSVLMDVETLEEHLDLAVPGPPSSRAILDRLSVDEQVTLGRLHDLGDMRLEQERLAWPWVEDRLVRALADLGSSATGSTANP